LTYFYRKREFSQREMRGLALLARGGMIRRINKNSFHVRSSDLQHWYRVNWTGRRWICSCKDHFKRAQSCKHVFAVLFLSRLPQIILSNFQSEDITCPECHSSNLIRKGLIHHKEYAGQRFRCKDCKHLFEDKDESTAGLKGNPQLIIAACDLFFKGLSLRVIADFLKKTYQVLVSHPTIHRWIHRMIERLSRLEKDHSLPAGSRWHVDETVIKVGGAPKYLWNVLDAETRLLLASELTSGRTAQDAKRVIEKALQRAEKPPKEIVTDGLSSYHVTLSNNDLHIKHIQGPRFSDPVSNQLVERLNGTVKSRTKGFRRLDNSQSSAELFNGLRLYYNNQRPHSSLGGKTPSEASKRQV
jgi:putative transposase